MASSMAPFWRPSLATLNSLSSPSTAHSTLSASNGDVVENSVIVRSGSVHSKRSSGCRFTFPAVPQHRRRKVVTVAKMDPKSASRSAPYFIALSFLPIVAFFGTVIFLTYYADPVKNATPVNLVPARKNLIPLKTRTAAKTLGIAKQRAKALRLGIEEPHSRQQQPSIFPRAYPEGRVERLSKSIIPLIYNLELDVYLPYRNNLDFGPKNFTIDGRLYMTFRCDGPKVDTIRLHAMNLTFDWKSLKVQDMGNGTPKEVEIKSFAHSEATTILKLVLRDHLENGRNYNLSIRYTAKVNSRVEDCGMFRSFYFVGQEKRYLAVTHLQPFYARRLFPCIDQPDFKAKFHLTVRHPRGTNVVSNTRLRHFTQVRRDWSESRFEPTPKMSTYLLAIAISDYPSKETRYKQHKIRAWVQPAMVNELDYALQVTVKALGFFEDYFGIPYPLTKLDIFGVPYLAVEAMENWGLLMFRQQHIVYSSAVHSVSNRRRLTDTLMHEIGHMWFGNLVTMEWWNDLWLNEGFATMMSAKAADFVENTTVRHDELFFGTMRNIMSKDQTRINPPLSHATDTFPGIQSTFGAFTYWKGSAIVRMFEKTIGPKIFRVGIRKYLREFSYGSTNAMDLLTTLDGVVAETASQKIAGGIWENVTIVNYMNTWVLQPGFPLLQITRANNTAQSSEVFVNQKLLMTSGTPLSKAAIRWKVPLFKNEGEGLTWLEHENMTLKLPPGKLIDPGSFGYYRVAYDAQSYEHFISILHKDHTQLPLTARFRLLEDSFILARIERLPYSTVFRICEYLVKETEYMPLYVFTIHMHKLHQLFLSHKDESEIQVFITRLLKPAYDRAFSADPRNEAVEVIQELTMSQLCTCNYEPCLEKALKIFADLKKTCGSSALSNASCNNIFPALRETVYMTAIVHGSRDDFMFVKEKFLIENDDVERDRLKTALAVTTNVSLFDQILWDSIIPLGDVYSMDSVKDFFMKCFSRTSIHQQLITYMRSKFKSIVYRTRHPGTVYNTIVGCMLYWLHTDKDTAELEAFIKDHPAELGIVSLSPTFIQHLNQAKDQGMMIFYVTPARDLELHSQTADPESRRWHFGHYSNVPSRETGEHGFKLARFLTIHSFKCHGCKQSVMDAQKRANSNSYSPVPLLRKDRLHKALKNANGTLKALSRNICFAERPIEIACNECDCTQAAESWVKPNDIHSFSYTPCALVCCRSFGLCFTSRDCPNKDHICFIVTDSFLRQTTNERRRAKARFAKKHRFARDQEQCGKPTRCRCGPPTDISPHKNETLTIGCPEGCPSNHKCLYQNEEIDFKCYFCTRSSCSVANQVINGTLPEKF